MNWKDRKEVKERKRRGEGEKNNQSLTNIAKSLQHHILMKSLTRWTLTSNALRDTPK